MWPEVAQAAAYILNRTPTRSLDGKTPIQALYEYLELPIPKAALHHLVPYGSIAYAHKKEMERLDKLEPKAVIGWLCGYESTNIFRIWCPSLHTVISTRDVTFDSSKRYSNDVEFLDEIEEIVKVRILSFIHTLLFDPCTFVNSYDARFRSITHLLIPLLKTTYARHTRSKPLFPNPIPGVVIP
jgi:hypothetical protein